MRTDLVLDALRMALTRRQSGANVELIHHSDAGSQYTSYAFQQVLDDHGVLASIGSIGDAHDNAMAESFDDSDHPNSRLMVDGPPHPDLLATVEVGAQHWTRGVNSAAARVNGPRSQRASLR
jgi:putative transposase